MDIPKPVNEGECSARSTQPKEKAIIYKKKESNNLMNQRNRQPSQVVVCSDEKCGWK